MIYIVCSWHRTEVEEEENMPLKRQSTKNSESDLKEQDFDFNFKFLMLGNNAVGKSYFLVRYTQHFFAVAAPATVAVESIFKTVVRNDKNIKLHIMDTGEVFLLAFVVILI